METAIGFTNAVKGRVAMASLFIGCTHDNIMLVALSNWVLELLNYLFQCWFKGMGSTRTNFSYFIVSLFCTNVFKPYVSDFCKLCHWSSQLCSVSRDGAMQNITYLSPANEVGEDFQYDLKALRAPVLDGWKHTLFNACLRSVFCGALRTKLLKDSGLPQVVQWIMQDRYH